MRKLLKAIFDIFRSDPRTIGVTGEVEEKPFYKNKKTLGIGGLIIAVISIIFRFALRSNKKKDEDLYEDEDEI